MIAVTRRPSPEMARCELTYLDRAPVDLAKAEVQHQSYCSALAKCGARVVTLDRLRDYPDCAFVEDTAIVCDEFAVIASMGTASRRPEVDSIANVLEDYRSIHRIKLPAVIEGGDVLRIGRTLFVGRSSRTNQLGIHQLAEIAEPLGYSVVAVPVTGCLHLKTACTAMDDNRILMNPAWVDASAFQDFEVICVPESEPFGANLLRCDDTLISAANHVETIDLLASLGFQVMPVELSEFAKAEAGVTCLSLMIP